jgi:glycosyltransferase involved in cell wall biosynthesis
MLLYQVVITLMVLGFVGMVARNLRDYAPAPPDAVPPRPEETLFVLIPARDEAENIAECVEGWLRQEGTALRLLVLDDASTDGTDRIVAEIAARDARVSLLRGEPKPAGWAGKVWACRQLGDAALAQGASWLLFVDADTRARPGLATAALHHAQTTGADMVSTFPYQITGTFAERVVLPMLHFLILTFLPVRMVWESPFPQLVAACGQFELFAADAYRAVGGHAALPTSFHDGLQLARRIKASGRSVRLFDGSDRISCRMYAGGRAVWNGFTRNAYEGLGSVGALVTMTVLQIVVFLAPFLFLLYALGLWQKQGHLPLWGVLCAVQVSLILLLRLLQARRFGHYESVLLHPLSIVLMVAIQWASFWKSLRKTPVVWKGRSY